MRATIIKILGVALAGVLAMGDIGLLFGMDEGVGISEIFLGLFVLFYITAYPTDVIRIFKKTKIKYVLGVALIFACSGIFYLNSSYDLPAVNYKLLACILFFCVLTSFFLRFPEQLHRSLLAYSIASILFVVLVIYVVPGASVINKGQLIVLGENPNSTSSRVAIAAVYLFAFCIQNPLQSSRWRFLFAPGITVLLVLIVESGSRGSLLAVAAAFFVLIMFSNIRIRHKLIMAGIAVLAVSYVAMFLLAHDGLSDRWMSAAEGDTAGRADIWVDALKIFFHSPLFGIGEAGYFQEIYYLRGVFIDTHNVFLYVSVCGGVLSLALFCGFLFSIYKRARISMRTGDILPLVLWLYMILIAFKTGAVLTYLLMWYVFSVVLVYPQASQYFYSNKTSRWAKGGMIQLAK